MKNKKSSLYFLPLLVIISVIILTDLYIVLLNKNVSLDKPIGNRQFDLLKTYLKGEAALFYIDQSAKYSLQQAVYNLALDGGLSDVYSVESLSSPKDFLFTAPIDQCGRFYGYSLWHEQNTNGNSEVRDCFNYDKIQFNLEFLFNQNLNNYLEKYPKNIRKNNYNYEMNDNIEITGKAKETIQFEILKDENKPIVIQPKDEQIQTTQGIANFKGLTGTDFCAKGESCSLTQEAYQKLQEAQKIANEKGKSLEVYSAYRDYDKLVALWEGQTPEKYKQRFPDEKERAKYVCNPYKGTTSCPHMTGNAVDVRFKDTKMELKDWRELENIMYKAGFRRYAVEVWHFECCGTDRYDRALALEKETGKEVRAIT